MKHFVAFRYQDGTKAKAWANDTDSPEEARQYVLSEPNVKTVLVGVPTPPGVVSSPIPDHETEVQRNAG